MTDFKHTKSDELDSLRKLFSDGGLFAQFNNLFQVNLILDANAILKDIRWLVCKASNPQARTSLIESIDAKTVIAFAPTFLEKEIQKNIPLIAEEEGVDVTLFFQKWESIKGKINFIDSGGPSGEGQGHDPKDAPYVNLHNQTGYPVLSADADISQMGAKAINVEVMLYTRDYSREAAVEYKIKAGFLGTFVVTSSAISATFKFIQSLTPSIKKIPMWAWVIIIVGVIFLLSNKSFKTWLTQITNNLSEKSKDYAQRLIEILTPLVQEHQQRQKKADLHKKSFEKELD